MFGLFKGANLQGVKMLCSNAEGASLKGCNFEDPSGLKANLEGDLSKILIKAVCSHIASPFLSKCFSELGANLKGVDMEGSQMTGINLRVATLKNAKLKNCNLRGATLAGTDLEVIKGYRKGLSLRGRNKADVNELNYTCS